MNAHRSPERPVAVKVNNSMHRVECIHFVGIGGAGMGGIAEVLLNQGYRITGSDIKKNGMSERLQNLGASVYYSHSAENIIDADVVVISTAIPLDNIEVVSAKEKRIPVVRRAEMLAELMRFQFGIAIAGTHGKTTTTSLVTSILAEADEDPTFVIGGLLNSVQTNARLGEGKYLVAEADESDASFHHLQPILSVVTNIDVDHMDAYAGDVNILHQNFIDFLHNLPFYGAAVMCLEDEGVQEVISKVHRRAVTYGLNEQADIYATDIKYQNYQTHFKVVRKHQSDINIHLNLPGQHNVLNALAAIAIAQELSIDDEAIVKALYEFKGIGRRFDVLGAVKIENGNIQLVDDYAHHPRELEATLKAARQVWPERRIVSVFQPHRYTRTRDLMDDFVQVLSSNTDQLILTDVYPAGEKAIAKADSASLTRAIRARGDIEPILVSDLSEIARTINSICKDNDVVIVMGAGNIGSVAKNLPLQIEELLNAKGENA